MVTECNKVIQIMQVQFKPETNLAEYNNSINQGNICKPNKTTLED